VAACLAAQPETFEPQSYLRSIRNVRPGLRARSKIIAVLKGGSLKAGDVASITRLGYRSVTAHLRAMEGERVVTRSGKRPFAWTLTEYGQQSVLRFA